MKITYNWLKEYVDIDVNPYELAKQLTNCGPEIASVKQVGINSQIKENIFLAKVTDISPHPESNKLKICSVVINKEKHEVITNSTAIEKGDYVVYAIPTIELPNKQKVEPKIIKGIKSEGMLLAKENLNLEEKSNDIWILGKNEKQAEELFSIWAEEDYVYEIELTANRPDCLSVLGIAREIAAIYNKELKINFPDIQENLDIAPNIEIKEKNLCPRYSSRILKNVFVKESPEWIKRKLSLCGIRPINNIVDATNYVLLDIGNPTHAFDLKKLKGEKIIVKKAKDKEEFTTLDSKKYTLTSEMLVISDEENSVALAGIMGGENSEISNDTKEVLLECAYFDPINIRKTSKQLQIKTESSMRFEKGVDRSLTNNAIDKIASIIQLTCPDAKISRMTDVFNNIFKERIINVSEEYINNKIGENIPLKTVETILKNLGFSIAAKREDSLEIKVPSFRTDMERPIDIVEEVARIYGYNKIPETIFLPKINTANLSKIKFIEEHLEDFFIFNGFTETYNFSFTNEEEVKKYLDNEDNIIKLQNPLSASADRLRNNLYMGLLNSIDFNVKNLYSKPLKFYEIGSVFTLENNNYIERKKVGFAIYSPDCDYYSCYEVVDKLLYSVGAKNITIKRSNLPFLHPKNSAFVYYNNEYVGYFGEIHPDIILKLELKNKVYVAEMDVFILERIYDMPLEIKPYSKYPAIDRDLSLVIDNDILVRDIQNTVSTMHDYITNVDFVDVYKSPALGENKKSITLSISFKSMDRTLTDDEVNEIMEKIIIPKLSKLYNAELRK